MAILDAFPGLEVTVQINGETAKEYDDPDEPSTDTCAIKYIEAKPGASFTVHIKKTAEFAQPCHHIAWQTLIDNMKLSMRHENEDQGATNGIPMVDYRKSFLSGNDKTGWFNNTFRFAALATNDDRPPDRELLDKIDEARNYGVIRVGVFYMNATEEVPCAPRRSKGSGATLPKASDELPEKSLKGKAKDCRTEFTQTPARAPKSRDGVTTQLETRYFDPLKRPFAKFEIRYRYLEGLMREGIVPRPSLAEATVNSMTEAEVRKLAIKLLKEKEEEASGVRASVGARSTAQERPAEAPVAAGRGQKRDLGDIEGGVAGGSGRGSGSKKARTEVVDFDELEVVDLTED